MAFEKIKHTICYHVWQDGWVTDRELQNDIDFGRKWPSAGKRTYKKYGQIILDTAKKWPIFKLYLWPLGYSYIKATSNYMENDKLKSGLWWVPFLVLIPGGLLIAALMIYFKSKP